MATVVRAIGIDGVEVALKISNSVSDRYYADALIAETEILQKLDNPGVVKILPIQTDNSKTRFMKRAMELDGNPWFFAMEYLEGGSLRDWLNRVIVLAPGEAAFVALKVAWALDYVHSKEYVHNNVKTDNILFRGKLVKGCVLEPVLIDFGIFAKTRKTQQDAGSLQWMSPERLQQIRGALAPEVNVDATKVDIYAIGVLLYRMLTTKMPFSGMTESGHAQLIRLIPPSRASTINSKVPSGLDELIMACLTKRPEARPTIPQLIKELSVFSEDQVVTLPKAKIQFSWFK